MPFLYVIVSLSSYCFIKFRIVRWTGSFLDQWFQIHITCTRVKFKTLIDVSWSETSILINLLHMSADVYFKWGIAQFLCKRGIIMFTTHYFILKLFITILQMMDSLGQHILFTTAYVKKSHFLVITFQHFILHVWLRITDEGSVPEMRIWSISLI